MDDDLMPIGRFSRMSRLSIKALRNYDEQGLLVPAWIDPSSGYRYYRSGQANQAEAIRILRSVDMPLDEIAELLAADDPDLVTKRLGMHRERLEERLADQARMLRFLQRIIDQEGSIMPYDITIKSTDAESVASWTTHTNLTAIGDDIGRGFATVVGAVMAKGLQPAGIPFIVYHDVIDEQTDGSIEICVPVPSSPPATGDAIGEATRDDGSDSDAGDVVSGVVFKQVEAATVASTVHRGPYDEISPAYHTTAGWIHEHGHQIQGPPRELYLNDPQSVAPEDLLTEVQFPIDDPA